MMITLIEMLLVGVALILSSLNAVYSLIFIPTIAIEVIRDIKCDEMTSYFRNRANSQTLTVFFIVIVILTACGVSLRPEYSTLLITAGLVLKNLIAADRILKRSSTIKWTGYSLATILGIFTIASHGFSIEGLIELILAMYVFATTIVALNHRILGALMSFSFAAFFSYEILRGWAKSGGNVGRIVSFLLLVLPMVYLGLQSLRREEEV